MPLVVAVLDANVLLPAPLRDTLLRTAAAGLYQARWSDDILREVERNLVSDWRLTESQAQRVIGAMSEAFPEALALEYVDLIERMPNHPKDRHVLAAAVACGASVIVTQNLRDFPQGALSPLNIDAQSADEFLLRLCSDDAVAVVQVVVEQAQDLRNPPKSALDVVAMLARSAPAFAARMRDELGGE